MFEVLFHTSQSNASASSIRITAGRVIDPGESEQGKKKCSKKKKSTKGGKEKNSNAKIVQTWLYFQRFKIVGFEQLGGVGTKKKK